MSHYARCCQPYGGRY